MQRAVLSQTSRGALRALGPFRPLRRPLAGSGARFADVARSFRDDRRTVALTGSWAGGAAILASDPVAVAGFDDPFSMLDQAPELDRGDDCAIGGGWFGYLGYQLGRTVEALRQPPPRPIPRLDFSLAFYDNVLVYEEATDQWWFEALWTPERAGALEERRRHSRLA